MAGTGWTSPDLLSRFNRFAGRPPADAIGDTVKYGFLADGQDSVITEISPICGRAMYNAPTAMTSTDGGFTWGFGLDGNGYALTPIAAHIYPTLNAVPDYPWVPGKDYMDEGELIRMPNNIAWGGSLYWQGIVAPQQISASVESILFPPPARILIVIRAVQQFADEAARNPALSDQMQIRWEKEFPRQMTMIRKHLRGRRTLGPLATAAGRGLLGSGANPW